MKADLKCKKCGSPNTYTTLNERVCRRCGHRSDLGKKDPKEAQQKTSEGGENHVRNNEQNL